MSFTFNKIVEDFHSDKWAEQLETFGTSKSEANGLSTLKNAKKYFPAGRGAAKAQKSKKKQTSSSVDADDPYAFTLCNELMLDVTTISPAISISDDEAASSGTGKGAAKARSTRTTQKQTRNAAAAPVAVDTDMPNGGTKTTPTTPVTNQRMTRSLSKRYSGANESSVDLTSAATPPPPPATTQLLVASPPKRSRGGRPKKQPAAANKATNRNSRRNPRVATPPNRQAPPSDDYILIGSPPTPAAGLLYDRMQRNALADVNSKPNTKGKSDMKPKYLDLELDEFDEENPLMSVKIRFNGKCEAINLRKHSKFSNAFKVIADREAKSVDDYIFSLNDKLLNATETPASVGYKITQLIDMKYLPGKLKASTNLGENKQALKAGEIIVKVQMDVRRQQPLSVVLNTSETFKVLYFRCADEFDLDVKDVQLMFDGEQLEYADTPDSHDMSNGDVIDLRVKKN